MALTLGKTFDRSYTIRLPFLEGHYNIGIFFNKRSSFLLFNVDPDFSTETEHQHGIKINMFKNLESSKFCETFLTLHNYRKATLDIVNQFENIKPIYHNDVNFILNESINLAKIEVEDKIFYDTLLIYGFSILSYLNEYVFLITERQHIIKRLNKKIVRTTGIQIGTVPALNLLNEFHNESKTCGKVGLEPRILNNENTIRLSDVDKEIDDASR